MKKQLTMLFFVAIGIASLQAASNWPITSENSQNLNSLLTLRIGANTLYLQDFILNPLDIDSITATSKKLKVEMSDDKYTASLTALPDMEHFVDVKLWLKGIPYSVPCRKTDKVDYVFTFNPQEKTYKRVQIAGQMNDWAPSLSPDLKLNTKGLYEVSLNLSPGTYLYQMLLDGDQNHDANNPNKVDNGYGKFNSILQVSGQGNKSPKLFSDKFSDSNITLIVQNAAKEIFVYWQNFRLPVKQVKMATGKISIQIPAEAAKVDRSFIRAWASNESGVSNDMLI